jgi:hypothetical protein
MPCGKGELGICDQVGKELCLASKYASQVGTEGRHVGSNPYKVLTLEDTDRRHPIGAIRVIFMKFAFKGREQQIYY